MAVHSDAQLLKNMVMPVKPKNFTHAMQIEQKFSQPKGTSERGQHSVGDEEVAPKLDGTEDDLTP